MNTADDIREMLLDGLVMVDHGFFVQSVTDGIDVEFEPGVEDVLVELLSSRVVEIGEVKELHPGVIEFTAWRGTVSERIERAKNAVCKALGQDKHFAYWLRLREKVDRYE